MVSRQWSQGLSNSIRRLFTAAYQVHTDLSMRDRNEHGVRRVNEVVGVPGRVENDVIETEPIFVRHGTELGRTGGLPPRLEQFERRGIDVHRILSAQLES